VHVLKSGLSRLGRGEFDVKLDLPPATSRRAGQLVQTCSAPRAVRGCDSKLAAGQAPFESVVDRLEDAVAMFNPEGQLLFANAAMRTSWPERVSDHSERLEALPKNASVPAAW